MLLLSQQWLLINIQPVEPLSTHKNTLIFSVSDPDPHWIRSQQPQGSGSGIRISNADPDPAVKF